MRFENWINESKSETDSPLLSTTVRSRISRRVITEQHIALTSQFRERQHRNEYEGLAPPEEERRVGIVDTRVNAADVARKCAELVKRRGGLEAEVPVIIEGQMEECFAYISEHIEYVHSSSHSDAELDCVCHNG